MKYQIKPEYIDLWEGGDTPSNPNRIITEEELEMIARGWDELPEDLMNQLIPIED